VLFSGPITLSKHLTPSQGVWVHPQPPPGVSTGGLPTGTHTRQLARDKPHCRLRAGFRTRLVHSRLSGAPAAKLPLRSSSLVNRNQQPFPGQCTERCPFIFKTKFCKSLQSKGDIVHFLGMLLVPPLEGQQLEQAAEMARHRASTLSAKAGLPEQWKDCCSPRGQCRLLASLPAQQTSKQVITSRGHARCPTLRPPQHTKPHVRWRKQSAASQMQVLGLSILNCPVCKDQTLHSGYFGQNISLNGHNVLLSTLFSSVSSAPTTLLKKALRMGNAADIHLLQVSSFLWIWQLLQTTQDELNSR